MNPLYEVKFKAVIFQDNFQGSRKKSNKTISRATYLRTTIAMFLSIVELTKSPQLQLKIKTSKFLDN